VTRATQTDVDQLFSELDRLRQQWEGDVSHCDGFVRTCLAIIRILVNDDRITKVIGKELSLIVSAHHGRDPLVRILGIRTDFENELEENLRGFSNLYNWVLEENEIRIDPVTLLSRVPGITPPLIHCFDRLTSELLAFFDLEDAFELNASKVANILFLQAISEVFDEVMGTDRGPGERLIMRWLKERVKNEPIERLFHAAVKRPQLAALYDLGFDGTRDLWILLICHLMAEGVFITKAEQPLMDMALKNLGMLGIRPFLESGALSLKDEICRDHETKKADHRLFRIK